MLINIITNFKKWKNWNEGDREKFRDLFKYHDIDSKIDSFTSKIDEIVGNINTDDVVVLMNPSCSIDIDFFYRIVEYTFSDNHIVTYSPRLSEFDYSRIDIGSFIAFKRKFYKKTNKKFSDFLQFQKYILSYMADNPNNDLIGFDYHNNYCILHDQIRQRRIDSLKFELEKLNKKLKDDHFSSLVDRKKEIKKMEQEIGYSGFKPEDWIDEPYFEEHNIDKPKEKRRKKIIRKTRKVLVQKKEPDTDLIVKGRKPRILFLCDVKDWAWWNKSKYIQEFLSDEFEIDLITLLEGNQRINEHYYDLYFTYGHGFIHYVNRVPKRKRITGVTAHRDLKRLAGPMNLAYATHANSLLLLNDLQRIHQRTFYLPNGVDERIFYPREPIPETRNNIIVGYVGKESSLKGQKEFIFPAIKESCAESVMNLRNYRNRLPHSEMWKIYQEMDVFIVASSEDGTPNGALEAAACGRPIISNRIGNMPELIEDGINGFLVDRKISSYVEKINYLRENRNVLIEMGNKIREKILAEWTWKTMAENYRNMFKTLIKYET